MGYASRRSHLGWYSIYTATFRRRLAILLHYVTRPRGFVRAFRGQFLSWLRGRKVKSLRTLTLQTKARPVVVMTEEERTLRECAAHIEDEQQLNRVLAAIEEPGQRALIRARLVKILAERKRCR